jgi:hypothetical protein
MKAMTPTYCCVVLSTALSIGSATSVIAQDSTPAPVAAPAPQAAVPASPNTLLDGTPIKMRISETVSSADAKVGQEIPFEVLEDVNVNGLTVIPKGASAIATVTAAEPKRSMGRAGKLDISISYVRLRDQEKVALRAVKDVKGGGHVGAMTGAIVATSIVFFPAAPLFLFIHGKDITIPQGTEMTAFVQGDMRLDMSQFGGARGGTLLAVAQGTAAASGAGPSALSCSLVVQSTPPGADIEIDGAFVGNTPSTLTLAGGSHQVVVKKQGFADWSRNLNVTGGTINLNVEMNPAGN